MKRHGTTKKDEGDLVDGTALASTSAAPHSVGESVALHVDDGVDEASLASFLKARRLSLQPRLSQEALARGAKLSLPYIQKMEQGRAGNPSEEVLARIASALRL